MNKKDKLYFLIFAFSVLSLIVGIVLRNYGILWFEIEQHQPVTLTNSISNIISFVLMFAQLYLITGISTREKPKPLFFRTLAFCPTLVLLFWIPSEYQWIASFILVLASCLVLKPKFKTIVLCLLSVVLVNIVQLALIYIKTGIINFAYSGYELIDAVVLNIDQFIVLTVMYYVSRKVGDKYDFHTLFSRKSR